MPQHAAGDDVVGVRFKTGVRHGFKLLAAGQVLSQGAGMVDMDLHALGEVVQPPIYRGEIALGELIALKRQGAPAGDRDHLSLEFSSGDTVERFAMIVRSELEGAQPEIGRHRGIHDDDSPVSVNARSEIAEGRDAQSATADRIDELPAISQQTEAIDRNSDPIRIRE